MLAILINPSSLKNSSFEEEIRAFLASLRQSPAAPGFDKLRIAGDPERETRARREKDGINVDPTTWKEIHAAGGKLGLDGATIDRLAAG
jgi:uncharacterized oxidoreductase